MAIDIGHIIRWINEYIYDFTFGMIDDQLIFRSGPGPVLVNLPFQRIGVFLLSPHEWNGNVMNFGRAVIEIDQYFQRHGHRANSFNFYHCFCTIPFYRFYSIVNGVCGLRPIGQIPSQLNTRYSLCYSSKVVGHRVFELMQSIVLFKGFGQFVLPNDISQLTQKNRSLAVGGDLIGQIVIIAVCVSLLWLLLSGLCQIEITVVGSLQWEKVVLV